MQNENLLELLETYDQIIEKQSLIITDLSNTVKKQALVIKQYQDMEEIEKSENFIG